ncbi:hypothetical protein [Acinetobacter pragensis]|uniref:hypothetical protein n=1 Tax=Acinetobacter pragensis TaxID=1806892 RepID=UPI00333E84DD
MIEDQRHSPKLLIGIAGGLIAVIALFMTYQWMIASNAEDLPQHQADALPAKAAPAEAVKAPPAAASEAAANTVKLVEEDILKAPVPENASLAKEEVTKLQDIQLQLSEQEKSLNAQHADADQLIKLKEEQIKLLEAQLAQKP